MKRLQGKGFSLNVRIGTIATQRPSITGSGFILEALSEVGI